jgi:hypothetical protein
MVRRSQFGSCRHTAVDSLLDLDFSCSGGALMIDIWIWFVVFLMRYGSFLELFECHERVYFSLFYDGFVQGHG